VFKNYLTFQFAQNFDRACGMAPLEAPVKSRLLASSRKMLDHFAKSLSSGDAEEEFQLLLVALLSIKDCGEILGEAGINVFDIDARYEVVRRRLDQLTAAAHERRDQRLRKTG
jgi:hypothetical protein